MAATNVSWSGVVLRGPPPFRTQYSLRQLADGDDREPEGVTGIGEEIDILLPRLLSRQPLEALLEIHLNRYPWILKEPAE